MSPSIFQVSQGTKRAGPSNFKTAATFLWGSQKTPKSVNLNKHICQPEGGGLKKSQNSLNKVCEQTLLQFFCVDHGNLSSILDFQAISLPFFLNSISTIVKKFHGLCKLCSLPKSLILLSLRLNLTSLNVYFAGPT